MSTRKPSLADRAAPRPMSALEALEEARRAEAEKKRAAEDEVRLAEEKRALARRAAEEARERIAAQQAAQRQAAEAEARRRAEQARRDEARRVQEQREADDQAARDRAAFGPKRPRPTEPHTGSLARTLAEGRITAVLDRVGDGFEVLDVWSDVRPEVQAVLWQAHIKRARHEGDLRTMAVALVLATAFVDRPKALMAARVSWAGQEWAVWVDTDRKELLAALQPAERYLTGL